MGAFDPLHPAVVHLPIGLTFILPCVTIILFYIYKRDWMNRKGFVVLAVLHLILSISSFVAMETGEDQEDKVEKVVNEKYIEEHEESAEVFTYVGVFALVFSVVLLFLSSPSSLRIGLAGLFVVQLALLFLAFRVGHAGGELVYKHGAADAYVKEIQ